MIDAALTPMSDHWKAFVDAIGKPGAVVRVDVPHNNVWSGHTFGSATQFIADRIASLDQEKPL